MRLEAEGHTGSSGVLLAESHICHIAAGEAGARPVHHKIVAKWSLLLRVYMSRERERERERE